MVFVGFIVSCVLVLVLMVVLLFSLGLVLFFLGFWLIFRCCEVFVCSLLVRREVGGGEECMVLFDGEEWRVLDFGVW